MNNILDILSGRFLGKKLNPVCSEDFNGKIQLIISGDTSKIIVYTFAGGTLQSIIEDGDIKKTSNGDFPVLSIKEITTINKLISQAKKENPDIDLNIDVHIDPINTDNFINRIENIVKTEFNKIKINVLGNKDK